MTTPPFDAPPDRDNGSSLKRFLAQSAAAAGEMFAGLLTLGLRSGI